MKIRISFYPLFRVDLVQMMRHREIKSAIALAGAEFRIALRRRPDVVQGSGSAGGMLMVPTPLRARAMGYVSDINRNDVQSTTDDVQYAGNKP